MKNIIRTNMTIWFLVAVILIDFMGMATVVVLFPSLLLGDASILPLSWSQDTKLLMMGIFLAIYPLGQTVGASALGKLSDYYGRKRILLLTLFGTFLGFCLSGVAIDIHSPILLFISRLMAGICAGNVAIAQASLLDLSTSETKAKNISLAQMAMGSAYIVGPILGGWLSQKTIINWFSMSTPFWFFSIVLVAFFAITIVFYQETLVDRKKEKIDMLTSIKQIYSALTDSRLGKTFFVWLTFVSGWWLFEAYMPAFLLQVHHYNTIEIGHILAFNGALYASFQYFVVSKISKKMHPQNMVIYSSLIAGLSIVSIILATNAIQLYTAMSIFVMAMGFAIPGLITYISNLSDASDQGQVMGMVNSIQAVSTVLVMLAGGYLNSMNSSITVVGGGLLVCLSWVLFLMIAKPIEKNNLSVAS